MNYETLIGDFDGQIQKLLAENAALKEQVAQLDSFRNETLLVLEQTENELTAQLDAAMKDAERYRWLRDAQGGKEVRIKFRTEWNDSIDAAIAKCNTKEK